jgi:hypothetical protein
MKIKRTKTGTKTSDSKHEIVKTEQNGNVNSDDSAQAISSKKQANVIGVPASPSSTANKRGNNSHRKDKVDYKALTRNRCFLIDNSIAGKGKSADQRKVRKCPHHSAGNCLQLRT